MMVVVGYVLLAIFGFVIGWAFVGIYKEWRLEIEDEKKKKIQ
jgi:uncharacterized membrane protein